MSVITAFIVGIVVGVVGACVLIAGLAAIYVDADSGYNHPRHHD